MKEVSFIRRNIEKWRSLEELVDEAVGKNHYNPGELADAYSEITTDLSFARSHYPNSRISLYLNNLASALHNYLYKNKKEPVSRFITFWTQEVPETMYLSRRELLYSFLVFAVSIVIGVVSTFYDEEFPRLILGNGYVDMTLQNIENGEPMAVYGNSSEIPMFRHIVFNNIRVAFNTFVMGLLTGFGTGYMLFFNGIMVGSFQTFFFQYGVGFDSMLAIWLHGTFEISAIIVAGAAGFALGNGWLFPGTYPRGYAFRQGAKRGLKITAGLVPVFLTAGFIESFLTRHTEFPDAVRIAIIAFSLAMVIYYYIILPKKVYYGKSKTQN
ncbi:MAG: stage II sporulation protein M [Dysgonamonadaceae bacterium]|jgi:uncharacterized membrane protein SpoIIM required for sporulation|nr:stage II sporulation protein M [Dysgonamonadaceae bacterium]